ncbi:nucleotide-diphospho-sugar transferase, partial [Pelagophyceae sp. CCMP2097]
MAGEPDVVARVRRRELLSPFNFCAFYLPHILDADRILYVDTDVVVRADVSKLRGLDMGGHAAAATEDCSQKLSKYINFQILGRVLARRRAHGAHGALQFDAATNETCVFNRGVVLFDAAKWRNMRLTSAIEELIVLYVKSRARLWRGGVSQPPFLLALAGRYADLGLAWNVRGLG